MHDEDGYFDERIAARYDESSAEMFDPALVDPVVDVLVEVVAGGRAFELGIGTGRIALPLAQRGAPVYGIESERSQPGQPRQTSGVDAVASSETGPIRPSSARARTT